MHRCNLAVRMQFAFKCIGTLIQLDRHRTVVYLIGNGKGRVVVVRRSDKPGRVGYADFSVFQLFGIPRPLCRNKIEYPLFFARHLKYGKHFRKVILNARQVHLVQHDQAWILAVICLIQGTKKFRFVESFGKLVEISKNFGTVTIGRLHRNDGCRIFHIAAEGIRKTCFTGTGNTFQNQQLAGSHSGNKTPDNLRCIIKLHLACRKQTVALYKFLKGNVIVKYRFLILLIFFIHKRKLRKTMLDLFLLFGKNCLNNRRSSHSCPHGDCIFSQGSCRHCRCRSFCCHCCCHANPGCFRTGYIFHRRKLIVCQCRSPHIRNPFRSAHGIYL